VTRNAAIYPTLLYLLAGLLLPAGHAIADPVAGTGLNRLAAVISQAPVEVRADFAAVALAELAATLSAEADRARAEARHRPGERDLLSWAAAADAYARELQALADDIAGAASIEVGTGLGPEAVAHIGIDGRLVMLTIPRPRQRPMFEQRIIEEFCSRFRCEDYLSDHQPSQALLQPVATQPRWSFSQQAGPACSTGDGLVFQFTNTTDLALKRRACSRVAGELNRLAERLAHEIALGVRVDWNRLAVLDVPGEARQLVTLNGDDEGLVLPLPALAGAPELFRQLRPWLAARVDGNSYRLVLLNSDRLMAGILRELD
jgi:hypothetical protein